MADINYQPVINYQAGVEEAKNIQIESNLRQTLSGATLGISSVLLSPFTSDETKKKLLEYKIDNPGESAIYSGLGSLGGLLLTGPLGALAKGATGSAEAGTIAAEAGTAAKAGISGYETLQGAKSGSTFLEAAQLQGIAGVAQSVASSVDTESLEPEFTVEHFGTYASDAIESGLIGAGVGAGFKAAYAGYNRYIKSSEKVLDASASNRNSLGRETANAVGNSVDNQASANMIKQGQAEEAVNFINEKNAGWKRSAEATARGEVPLPQDGLDQMFMTQAGRNPEVVENILTRQANPRDLEDKFKTVHVLNAEMDRSGTDLTGQLKNDVIKDASLTGSREIDPGIAGVRAVSEESLRDIEDQFFKTNSAKSLNTDVSSPFLNNGYIARVSPLIDQIANKKISRIFEGLLSKIATPMRGLENDQFALRKYAPKAKIVSQDVYKAFQGTMRELDSLSIKDPTTKQALQVIKDATIEHIASNFDGLGAKAAIHSSIISKLNGIEKDMYENLGHSGKLSPIGSPLREAEIHKSWERISDVADNAKFLKSTPEYDGWIEKAKNGITSVKDQLNMVIPSPDLNYITTRLESAFDRQQQNVKKIAALNDENIQKMFNNMKDLEPPKGAAGHGPSIKNRLSYMVRDLVAGFANPADWTRYAPLQGLRIATSLAEKTWAAIMGKTGKQNLETLLYNNMVDMQKLSRPKVEFMRSIKGLSSSLLGIEESLNKVKSYPQSIPSKVYSYYSRINDTQKSKEINEKYDNSIKNIQAMVDNPGLYAQRVSYAMEPIRKFSPDIADKAEKNVFQTVGLVRQMIPQSKDESIYKKTIPTSEKAKFLDNMDALTNPQKMISMMKDGTISMDQLRIFQAAKPDMWSKIVNQIQNDIASKELPIATRSRVYALFGITDQEQSIKISVLGQQAFQQQLENTPQGKLISNQLMLSNFSKAKMPHIKPLKVSPMKGFTENRNLSHKGMP